MEGTWTRRRDEQQQHGGHPRTRGIVLRGEEEDDRRPSQAELHHRELVKVSKGHSGRTDSLQLEAEGPLESSRQLLQTSGVQDLAPEAQPSTSDGRYHEVGPGLLGASSFQEDDSLGISQRDRERQTK